ncbi:MAG TPA: OmpA family protein [Gammaproteobacteria bacterium]|nr:OmpA family protein [Gammaproteobacteria bacterium]
MKNNTWHQRIGSALALVFLLAIGGAAQAAGPTYWTDSSGEPITNNYGDCWQAVHGAVNTCNDADGDGVGDAVDECPGTPKGVEVDGKGCPLDSDGDGVADADDRCPGTAAGVAVDDAGCPLDSDGDGVVDNRDRCPDTPQGTAVDQRGCPLDTDGDGVPDTADRCPGTPAGTEVDDRGCIETVVLGQQQLRFAVNEATLDAAARQTLDELVPQIADNPNIKQVVITGHTDSTGNADYNLDLSQRRAQAVRSYFIRQGVPAGKIVARGRGENEPVADNGTQEGRRRNRRVELDFRM